MTADPGHVAGHHLRVVGCPDCERHRAALAALQVDLDNAHTDLIVKRRRITKLQNELDEKYRTDPMYATAEIIFQFWRSKCAPTARTFSEDRMKAVLGRLKDRDPSDKDKPAYTPRYICEAIVGAAVQPYVKDGVTYNDLELICRNGGKLEAFHRRYEAFKRRECAA